MNAAIHFPHEDRSNAVRRALEACEPRALRTYTPSLAVIARSAGAFHWTPEGRRLYDYSSGVLVANLGHNPRRWMTKLAEHLGWRPEHLAAAPDDGAVGDCFEALPLTAYNALTEVESQAVERLLVNLQAGPGGRRLDTILWAASGSEAIQKALWACLHHDSGRDLIIATRHGFHGKKGLAGAVTGSENDRDRDPRVKFISFPMDEADDVSRYDEPLDLTPYRAELDVLHREFGSRLNCLITEPYLGGGGSYHPPAAYLQLLEQFCRAHDVLLILDEIQSNFGRTGRMYAFEKYGIEPDFVCLGKGLGNGVPVSAVAGRGEVMASLDYGEGSDTWSANPLSCAAVLATIDEFEKHGVLEHAERISPLFFEGLERLKQTPVVAKVRGEGMVFGVECAAFAGHTAAEVAVAVVEACYLGQPEGDGIHLLGPLAGTVLRVSPPLTITESQARESLALFYSLLVELGQRLEQTAPAGRPGQSL